MPDVENQEPDPPAAPARKPRRRRGLWLRIILVLFVAVLLFHQQVLLLGLHYAAIRLAKSQNLDLSFDVSGSLWTDLTISNLHAVPTGPSPIKLLDIRHASVRYDLAALFRPQFSGLIDTVVAIDVTIDIDERHLPPLEKGQPIQFPLIVPGSITLGDFDLHYISSDGRVIAVENFDASLIPGQPGYIQFAHLKIPGMQEINDYHAPMRFENRTLVLEDVIKTNYGLLKEFQFDASDTEKANLGLALAGSLLGGDLRLSTNLYDVNRRNDLKISLAGTNLALAKLGPDFPALGALGGVFDQLVVEFSGPVEQPHAWKGAIQVKATGLSWGAYPSVAVDVEIAIANGVVTFNKGVIQTDRDHLKFSGTVQLPEALNQLGAATAEFAWEGRIEALERFAGEAFQGSSDTRGSLKLAGGKLTLETALESGVIFPQGSVQGLVQKLRLSASTAELAAADAWRLIDLEYSGVAGAVAYGDIRLDSAAVDLKLTRGALDLSKAQLTLGRNAIGLTAKIAPESVTDFTDLNQWTASLTLDAPDLIPVIKPLSPQPVDGALAVHGTIRKNGPTYDGALTISGASLLIGPMPVPTLRGQIVADGDRIRISGLDASLVGSATLTLFGGIHLNEPYAWDAALSLSLPNASLLDSHLRAMAGRPVSATGNAAISAAASGDLSGKHPAVSAAAHVVDLRLDNIPVLSLDLPSAVFLDGKLTIPTLNATLPGGGALQLHGTFSANADQPFEGNLAFNMPNLAALQPILRLFGNNMVLAGRLSANGTAAGNAASGDYRGTIVADLSQARINDLNPVNARIEGRLEPHALLFPVVRLDTRFLDLDTSLEFRNKRLRIPNLRLGESNVTFGTGAIDIPLNLHGATLTEIIPADQTGFIRFEARNADLGRVLHPFLPQGGLEGRLNLSVNLEGTSADPTGSIQFGLAGFRAREARGFSAADLDLRLDLANRRIQLSGNLRQPQIQPIRFNGNLPIDIGRAIRQGSFDLNAPVSLEISMPPTSLAFLRQIVPGIRTLDGTAGLDVRVTGTVGRPNLSGSGVFAINTFRMENESIPPIYSGRAQLNFSGQRLTISGFNIEVAGGPLSAGGVINFPTLANPQLDLRIRGQDVLILRNDSMIVRTDLDLGITGPLARANVRGTIGVVHSRFFRDIEIVPLNVPGRPAPPMPNVRTRVAVDVPPFKNWTFDVGIHTEEESPFMIRGNLANGSVAIGLKLFGTGGDPKLDGTVRIKQLLASLPFSRLTINNGLIVFRPDRDPANPILDLRGVSNIRDYRIDVYVYGNALKPELLFVSQPPLPQEEIITLLATGVTTQEITSNTNIVAGRAGWLFLQRIYQRMFGRAAIEQQGDDFINRIDVDIGGIDPETGRQMFQGRFKINENFQLVGDVSLGGNVRLLLRYLVRFR